MKNPFASAVMALLLSLCTLNIFSKDRVLYTPVLNDNGKLSVPRLNAVILLLSLNNDSTETEIIIPKGVYYLYNNETINLKDHIYLNCDSVTFIYEWKDDEFRQDLISFYDITKSGIRGLTIDFRAAYKDKINWSSADKFVNRSIIQLEHSDSIFIQNVTILKILGEGIGLSNSSYCVVAGCNIIGSWVYGNENGTQGYGIDLVGTLTYGNVITNNIIRDCRHNIVIQYGANNNTVSENQLYEARASNKILWFEVYTNTMNLTLHGNSPHNNIVIKNYCDNRLSIDNVKTLPNGPGNQIIGNTINGLLSVESKAPDYYYNEGQIIKDNFYKTLRIEPKNCINTNNTKIK